MKPFNSQVKFLLPGLLLLLVWGCSTEDNVSAYHYQPPLQTADGWQTASLEAMGMDSIPLVNLMDFLLDQDDHLIHGLLIIKDNRLVFEEYFSGEEFDYTVEVLDHQDNTLDLVYTDFNLDTLHMCSSMTKSITSILFGIARDQGFIPDLNSRMFSYFQDYKNLKNPQNNEITISHMLSMATGLAWHDDVAPMYDSRNDEFKLIFSDDPIHFVLDNDVSYPPGTVFQYNSGITVLLGEIIRRETGIHLREFARDHLFTPLGIDNFQWYSLYNQSQITHAAGMLYLRPRDLAKIGQLILNDGLWNGNRIVSEEWIADSLKEVMTMPVSYWDEHRAYGYGYQWWLDSYANHTVNAYVAKGWGGQFIVVIPSLNMVVVHTAGGYIENDMWNVPLMYYDIIEDYILPAVQ